jgi:hypothetical protein
MIPYNPGDDGDHPVLDRFDQFLIKFRASFHISLLTL